MRTRRSAGGCYNAVDGQEIWGCAGQKKSDASLQLLGGEGAPDLSDADHVQKKMRVRADAGEMRLPQTKDIRKGAGRRLESGFQKSCSRDMKAISLRRIPAYPRAIFSHAEGFLQRSLAFSWRLHPSITPFFPCLHFGLQSATTVEGKRLRKRSPQSLCLVSCFKLIRSFWESFSFAHGRAPLAVIRRKRGSREAGCFWSITPKKMV